MQLQQSPVQSQQLKMTPQLYQSLKLLELPSLDLTEKIEEELERNPALEIIEDKRTVSLENDIPYKSVSGSSANHAADNYRRFIEGTLTRPETLQEHLLWQLQLEPIDEDLRKTAEMLIQNLDDDGFFIEDNEKFDISKDAANPAGTSPSNPVYDDNLIQKAVKLIQGFDPVGCCSKNYKDALKIQIDYLKDNLPVKITSEVINILLDNMDLIEREKYSQLAKITKTCENDICETCAFIKTLFPFPGRAYTSAVSDVRYVIPDIKVTKELTEDIKGNKKEELIINLNDEIFPVIGINKYYKKLSAAPIESASHAGDTGSSSGKEARDFARKNIREAKLFIDHLRRRNQTLVKCVNAIVQFQREFFLKGPKYLAPLTLKDIANELSLHEATISRVANGKYMQTEWGIFEIRYFFTNSISRQGRESSNFSKESVKEIIKEIIAAEKCKLSDSEISALLHQKGIEIARRTVAKYRKQLDMGSSYTRKPASK